MQTLAFVLARLSEPSSYAGLGAVLALAGFHFSDTDLGQLAQFLAAGCGLAALLLKERGVIPLIALAVMLGTPLGACSRAGLPAPATARANARTVLTTTQQAMCEAQSAANLASAVAAAAGDATAASEASKASAVAGVGCTWATAISPTAAS
jgi:hypothetical protein